MAVLDVMTRQRLERAMNVLARFGRVRGAYLFGSQVEGATDKSSDIDVAAFVDELDSWSLDQRLDAVIAVQEELGDDLDVHLFPAAYFDHPPQGSFAAYILRHGIRLPMPEESSRPPAK